MCVSKQLVHLFLSDDSDSIHFLLKIITGSIWEREGEGEGEVGE